jgi:hypothetical protein
MSDYEAWTDANPDAGALISGQQFPAGNANAIFEPGE